jgi:hypothetical protein
MKMQNIFLTIVLLPLMLVLSGCLATRPPAELTFTTGAVIQTLASNASLSYKNADRSISGSCYFMFRRPDQIRVVILSPFGSVLQEVIVSGELVTIIDSGNGVVLRGSFKDLPATGDFSAWRSIHWIIDIDQPGASRDTITMERVNRFGDTEKAAFKNGLLMSKIVAGAGQVKYGRYITVQGAAVPLEIEYETVAGENFSLLFEEPEVNIPFVNDPFKPNIDKFPVYPLSRLK